MLGGYVTHHGHTSFLNELGQLFSRMAPKRDVTHRLTPEPLETYNDQVRQSQLMQAQLDDYSTARYHYYARSMPPPLYRICTARPRPGLTPDARNPALQTAYYISCDRTRHP